MEINFVNTTQIRVRYGETDQMGYVYYGNYALFFEVGRVEAMREIGMAYRELEEMGIMLPVKEMAIQYKSAAQYDDLLTVRTEIVSLEGVRLLFNYEILKENKLLVTGTTTLVFVNKSTMRPTAPPEKFTALIKNVVKSAQ